VRFEVEMERGLGGDFLSDFEDGETIWRIKVAAVSSHVSFAVFSAFASLLFSGICIFI
jgi:hypothetical protein